MKVEKYKIIQIIPASTDVFACYFSPETEGEEGGLVLEKCPVLALIEEEANERREVIGLVVGNWDFEDPRKSSDFACYATSEDDAKQRLEIDR